MYNKTNLSYSYIVIYYIDIFLITSYMYCNIAYYSIYCTLSNKLN